MLKATDEELLFIKRQLIMALTILLRIRRRYPAIFYENVTDEEVNFVSTTYKNVQKKK